jgi:hypothetical protein
MEATQVRAGRFAWVATIDRYRWTVFLVCWLGWALDTTDFNLFSLVLRSAASAAISA